MKRILQVLYDNQLLQLFISSFFHLAALMCFIFLTTVYILYLITEFKNIIEFIAIHSEDITFLKALKCVALLFIILYMVTLNPGQSTIFEVLIYLVDALF